MRMTDWIDRLPEPPPQDEWLAWACFAGALLLTLVAISGGGS